MFQKMSNEVLLERFDKLVRREREITHLIIRYIAEIESRELCLPMGYPGIYEFLMDEHKYSRTSAGRRISAARLHLQVPEVAQKIEDGTLNLSQAVLLNQSIRASEKENSKSLTLEDKRAVIQKIENQSYEKTQQIICKELNVTPQVFDKSRTHGDGSVTLTITLSAEQAKRWRQVSELASHVVGAQNSAALIDYLAQKEIARRTEIKRASPVRKNPSVNPRAIAPNVRKILLGNTASVINTSGIDFPLVDSESQSLVGSSFPESVKFAGIAKIPWEAFDSCVETARSIPTLAKTKSSDAPKAVQIFDNQLTMNASTPTYSNSTRTGGCGFVDPKSGRRCGSLRFLQVDHRQSVWAGGTRDLANLQVLCSQHNRWKYKQEAGIKSVRLPHR